MPHRTGARSAGTMDPFHITIAKLRKEAGYKTPRSFFLDKGGARYFGCTYRHYYDVERGAASASPKLAEKLFWTLANDLDHTDSDRFARAYLKLVCGSPLFLEAILNAALRIKSGKPAPRDPLLNAIGKNVKSAARLVPERAARVILSSMESFWTYHLLKSVGRSCRLGELSRITGFGIQKLRPALKRLVASGEIAVDRKARYYAKFKSTRLPTLRPGPQLEQFDKLISLTYKRMSGTMRQRWLILRVSDQVLNQHMESLFNHFLALQASCDDSENGGNSLHFISLSIKNVLDF